MPQDATCPYCQAEQIVAVPEGDTSTMHVKCTNCGGVYEFMPDFGSFTLPDEGRGYRPTRQFGSTSPRQEFVVSGEDVPQTGGGGVCCCVIFLIIIFIFLDYIWQFLFG
ncbi:MAG: hypothetical protein ACFFF4_14055 [Candidatus Thorarchaeota archaeon]